MYRAFFLLMLTNLKLNNIQNYQDFEAILGFRDFQGGSCRMTSHWKDKNYFHNYPILNFEIGKHRGYSGYSLVQVHSPAIKKFH